jgi:hypothetical protein
VTTPKEGDPSLTEKLPAGKSSKNAAIGTIFVEKLDQQKDLGDLSGNGELIDS